VIRKKVVAITGASGCIGDAAARHNAAVEARASVIVAAPPHVSAASIFRYERHPISLIQEAS
jgi:NAD(P)-dependent dehydrogenase (short-subunit alcohol dehydrogenase family)